MASKNGIKKAITRRVDTSVSPTSEDLDKGFKTKALTVAHAHPTPRQPDLGWGCAGHEDPETFQPTSTEALAEAQVECAKCPATALCLSLGAARGEWGVWGGVLLENGKPVDRVRAPGRPKKTPGPVADEQAA